MPLHLAAEIGAEDMVRLFIEGNECSIDAIGKWRMTALHRAAWQGHNGIVKFLLGKGAKHDLRDVDGWTPLMAATREGHLTSMKELLISKGYEQANIRDDAGKTPFLVSVEDGELDSVCVFLNMSDKNKRDPDVYQRLLSYEAQNEDDAQQIQKPIFDALKEDKQGFNEALLWAAAKFERHKVVKKFLIWRNEQEPSPQPSAIELATGQKNPDLLWWLIATSPRTPDITKNIESAGIIAKKAQKEQENPRGGRPDTKRGNKNKYDKDAYDDQPPTDGNQSTGWEAIVDILQDPQIAQVYEDSAILKPPRPKPEHLEILKDFKILIARFYKSKTVSSTIRRTRDLKHTVYDKGPAQVMTTAISKLEDIMDKSLENRNDTTKSSRFQATYGADSLKFTYVHIPSTNMDWMKDLLLRIMVDEGNNATSYHEVSSFLQSTWFEIPDRTSGSRFMRPQFVERIPIPPTSRRQDKHLPPEQKEDQKVVDTNDAQQWDSVQEGENHEADPQELNEREAMKERAQEGCFIPSSALYMPFLSFATQTEFANEAPGKKSRELIQKYRNSVVHSSATLDEAYYHFKSGDKIQTDQSVRNRGQVVTKQLGYHPKKNQAEPWPLLRVNQIWIWTIADGWVITGTSHPVDDVEQSWLEGFTEHLNKQIQAGGAQSQPGSTKDMMKATVEYCIGSYERRRAYNRPDDGASDL
ncbi:uncharacterized protein F4822DRAFT_205399 [Hypoxylon trugodes]|uniref:uncharacterized protein n=1 Tax=Hypoxylon trugodes TaxID=326681 RepID=UPI0021975547|nr:uncharacterized protein F4822DRAFT_205399 [Hypoxylon trugodes]KAI1389580.1 hypothetical protein F4822DRAFT_205399 [Hypoxylon trugodes]